ncbi:hypothetical protein HUW42_04690 [Bradyrhizobium diazoefficiens]|nr:hypothetical protein HUW42_04690 [Bradyrhizobium diazoefficiens]
MANLWRNSITMGHQEEPTKWDADLTVDGFDAIHQDMNRGVASDQPLFRQMPRARHESDYSATIWVGRARRSGWRVSVAAR